MCDNCENAAKSPMIQAMADQGYAQGIDDVNRYLSLTFEWRKETDPERKAMVGWAMAQFTKGMEPTRLHIAFMILATQHVDALDEHLGGVDGIEKFLNKNRADHEARLKALGDFGS